MDLGFWMIVSFFLLVGAYVVLLISHQSGDE